jgi:hypothetical protein
MTDKQKELVCYSNTSNPESLGFMADIALSALSPDFTLPDLDASKILSVGGRSDAQFSSIVCKHGDESISIALRAMGDSAPKPELDTTPKFNG